MNQLTVHFRVNDAATGKPTPCRICIQDKEGRFYAPLGRSVEFPLGKNEAVGGQVLIGDKKWFYIDGACEITLPTETDLKYFVTKGWETVPAWDDFRLGVGQMILRFRLGVEPGQRSPKEFQTVDAFAHLLSPHDAMLEARAEGLDSVQLLATEFMSPSQNGELFPVSSNLNAFSGQKALLAEDSTEIVVNTFNHHPALGSLALLHSHRAVFPLSFGTDGSDDWSLCDWCDQCHRKKGLVVWVDALEEALAGGEALVAVLLGKVDAIGFAESKKNQARLRLCEHIWNLGIHLAVVGGSGKRSNRTPLGAWRTVRTRSETSWLDAVRANETWASNGALLERFNSEGKEGFQIIGCFEPERVDVVHNGKIIETFSSTEFGWESKRNGLENGNLDSGWIAYRATSKEVDPMLGAAPCAFSSPFWLRDGSTSTALRDAAAMYLRPMVERTRDWVETVGRFHNPKRKQHLLDLCDQALKVLDEKAGAA